MYDSWIPGYYDIALLKLRTNIQLGFNVQLIKLGRSNPPIGEEVTVVGFGAIECEAFTRNCTKSRHLRTTVMTVKSYSNENAIESIGEEDSNVCYVSIAFISLVLQLSFANHPS